MRSALWASARYSSPPRIMPQSDDKIAIPCSGATVQDCSRHLQCNKVRAALTQICNSRSRGEDGRGWEPIIAQVTCDSLGIAAMLGRPPRGGRSCPLPSRCADFHPRPSRPISAACTLHRTPAHPAALAHPRSPLGSAPRLSGHCAAPARRALPQNRSLPAHHAIARPCCASPALPSALHITIHYPPRQRPTPSRASVSPCCRALLPASHAIANGALYPTPRHRSPRLVVHAALTHVQQQRRGAISHPSTPVLARASSLPSSPHQRRLLQSPPAIVSRDAEPSDGRPDGQHERWRRPSRRNPHHGQWPATTRQWHGSSRSAQHVYLRLLSSH